MCSCSKQTGAVTSRMLPLTLICRGVAEMPDNSQGDPCQHWAPLLHPQPGLAACSGCWVKRCCARAEGAWAGSQMVPCSGLHRAGSGVLAHVLAAAASSSWADPAKQPVPLRSAPSPALAPGPPCFLAHFCPRPLPRASWSRHFAGCLQTSPGRSCRHPGKLSRPRDMAPPEHQDGGDRSIRAKCGVVYRCRGSGMGRLERLDAVRALCCSGAG